MIGINYDNLNINQRNKWYGVISVYVYSFMCILYFWSRWKKNVVGHLSTDYSKTFPFYCSTLNPFSADALFLPMTRLSAISMRRSYLSFIVLRCVFLFLRGQMWSYHLAGFEYIHFHPLFFSKEKISIILMTYDCVEITVLTW